jgi:hypothetical protein
MNKTKQVQRCQVSSVEFEKLSGMLDRLSLEQKLALAQKLLGHRSGLMVILGSAFAVPLSGSANEISQQLKGLPPEIFEELLKAIAIRLAQS